MVSRLEAGIMMRIILILLALSLATVASTARAAGFDHSQLCLLYTSLQPCNISLRLATKGHDRKKRTVHAQTLLTDSLFP